MSSLLQQFKAIFQAKANQAAEQMEDPRASLDYSLTRLEQNRRELARSLVEVSAARLRLENQRNQLAAGEGRYEEQAAAAIKVGRDDLARLAIERKQEAQARQTELEINLDSLEHQEQNLKQSQLNLDRKIALFSAKKEELKAIYDSSQAQLRVNEALSGISEELADVGNTIERAEARIQAMQARADAIEGLVAEGVLTDRLEPEKDNLDRQLERIGRSQAVEEELARLRAEAGS
jgi:phage shock protein A